MAGMMEFLRTPQLGAARRKGARPGGLLGKPAPGDSELDEELVRTPRGASFEKPPKSGTHRDTYDNDGYYEGQFLDGSRHGKGILVFRGFRYDGEWKQDKMHGKGKRVDSDGSTYYGDWKEGRAHGYGRLSNAEGSAAYAGEWRGGKRHGHGKQVFEHGDAYDGEWHDGCFHNRGTYYYKNGDKYTGFWKHGVSHGEGTMFFADGSQSRRYHDHGVLVTLQDFDLALGKYGQVVRRDEMQKHTDPPSRISAAKEKRSQEMLQRERTHAAETEGGATWAKQVAT